jgi:hypothetical protein
VKLPDRHTVRLPDGSEHGIAAITFKKDGTIARIDTFRTGAGTLKDPYYTIEGDELDQVTLITYRPSGEFWGN